jgi:hypothetical protein
MGGNGLVFPLFNQLKNNIMKRLFSYKPKTYRLKTCEEVIDIYINKYHGHLHQIQEGSLGLGKLILYGAKGKKSIIIEEIFETHWSCTHKIRMYNKLPKKYETLIY